MSKSGGAEEGFLRRWARLKSADEAAPAGVEPPATAPPAPPGALQPSPDAPAPEQARQLPTLEDVARLTPDSDYSAFVAKGVDKALQRMALKKLFADPNFAVMDGLDIYISDYNKLSPLTDAMLASLKHAPGVLSRLLCDEEQEAPAQPSPDEDAAGVAADGAMPLPQQQGNA